MEGCAYFGHHIGDSQLLFACSVNKLFVVPGIDLAGACDKGYAGEGFDQPEHQRAVGAIFKAGG